MDCVEVSNAPTASEVPMHPTASRKQSCEVGTLPNGAGMDRSDMESGRRGSDGRDYDNRDGRDSENNMGDGHVSVPGTRVFVGNLPYSIKWTELKDRMRAVGEVARVDIICSRDGVSKGCAIVEFATPEAAEAALTKLQDCVIEDRRIFLREDREPGNAVRQTTVAPRAVGRETRSAFAGRGSGRQLHVANLPFAYKWFHLKSLFGGDKVVEHADVAIGQDGRSRGHGFVLCHDNETAERLISEFDGRIVDGRRIAVKMDFGPPARDNGPPARD